MRGAQMTAKYLHATPALEANDVILLYRAADRYGRLGRLLHAPENGERTMDRDDQSDELIWSELMMPHIAADDAHDLIEIDPGATASAIASSLYYLASFRTIGPQSE
jgi:hypothetical protein